MGPHRSDLMTLGITLHSGEDLRVLGYPGNDGLSPYQVKLRNTDSQSGYYKVDGYLDHGLSGGPVFNAIGDVVALVEGGGRPGSRNDDLIKIAPAVALLQKWGVQAGIDNDAPSLPTCTELADGTQQSKAVVSGIWKYEIDYPGPVQIGKCQCLSQEWSFTPSVNPADQLPAGSTVTVKNNCPKRLTVLVQNAPFNHIVAPTFQNTSARKFVTQRIKSGQVAAIDYSGITLGGTVFAFKGCPDHLFHPAPSVLPMPSPFAPGQLPDRFRAPQ
jgi:hypothetical protein